MPAPRARQASVKFDYDPVVHWYWKHTMTLGFGQNREQTGVDECKDAAGRFCLNSEGACVQTAGSASPPSGSGGERRYFLRANGRSRSLSASLRPRSRLAFIQLLTASV